MRLVTPFIETSCHKCGSCDEAKFVQSGPHLKQICIDCGAYIKFFDKSQIPGIEEIKLKIFYMVDKNLDVIRLGKNEIEFIDGLIGLAGKLQYWKLYIHLRKQHAL